MTKTIDIFIKSYHKDYWLLNFALKSIARNVTGYNNIVLLIPQQDKDIFDTRNMPDRTLIHYIKDYQPGWLYQQVCKMQAYKYSSADYIMFTDSDCLWTYPVNVQGVIKDDKPEILYTGWEKVADAICWRKPTELFLGEKVPFEYMRRNQLTYHRETLLRIANFAPDLEKMIMESERFSEFNSIGSFAYKYEPENYTWTNTDNWTYVPPLAEQVWSHASKKEGVSDVHLREYIRTLETIMKSFGVNPPQ